MKTKKLKLFSGETAKMVKSEGQGYLPVILHLQPYKYMGKNLCPKAKGCADVCLQYSGMMVFSNSINARQERTKFFWQDRKGFIAQLKAEIAAHVRKAEKHGIVPCVRLNGTSDIVWEKIAPDVFTDFPTVQFYDYTKIANRFFHELPENYHLTFSQAENNQNDASQLLAKGHNVAVVFRLRKNEALPATYNGYPVIDGDTHDLRFTDKRGCVVGLRSKGRSYNDQTGFVVSLAA